MYKLDQLKDIRTGLHTGILTDALNQVMNDVLKDVLMNTVDTVMACLPYRRPSLRRIREAKVVAHRGYCGDGAKENTLEAFRAAQRSSTWGIEFDVRWTADDVPVISHDPTLERVFGEPLTVSSVTFETLRQRIPLVPTLAEVLSEFGGKCHLMIELKEILTERHAMILKGLLAQLEPVRDYHFISLQIEALRSCTIVPPQALLTVAEFNVQELSRAALEYKMGGVTGQYLLMSSSLIASHHQAQQKVGTGFVSSKRVLYRELNRGVDWLFTNHAREIMSYLQT